jgi:hypothetical protein
MPKLTYSATGFSPTAPPSLSGEHTLDFAWSELVWAAISVGRAGMRQILQFGAYSAFEMVYRIALLYANLQEMPSEYLTRSNAYNALDPSEASYLPLPAPCGFIMSLAELSDVEPATLFGVPSWYDRTRGIHGRVPETRS